MSRGGASAPAAPGLPPAARDDAPRGPAARRVPRAQLLAAAVVAGALAAGAALGVAGERVRAGRAQVPPDGWVDAFAEELALTPAQRAAVDSVLGARERVLDSLVAPVRPALDSARMRARRDIRARLTPGQQARFDAYVARMEARTGRRQQRR